MNEIWIVYKRYNFTFKSYSIKFTNNEYSLQGKKRN